MTAKEAAAHLGVGLSTVYEMFHRGELGGFRVRRRVVFYRAAVEAAEKGGRAGPPPQPRFSRGGLRPPPGLFRD
jgi:excisionase family DNA binding protein